MTQAQIFIDADALKGTQPLYEFIMHFLMERKIAGATVFRGRLGFNADQYLKIPDRLFSFDETPMLIVFIDEDSKVQAALTELRKEFKGGFITTHHVEQWK